jgi:hypothetical protein
MRLCGPLSGTCLQIVRTSPRNQKKHEKPETDEGCTQKELEGTSLKSRECKQDKYTPKERDECAHFDGGIRIAGSHEQWFHPQWYSEGERDKHKRGEKQWTEIVCHGLIPVLSPIVVPLPHTGQVAAGSRFRWLVKHRRYTHQRLLMSVNA